jgi:hypothetical protein
MERQSHMPIIGGRCLSAAQARMIDCG